ncbi:Alpha/beta hydrolase fold-3, partial [Dichotomocladium elegans]
IDIFVTRPLGTESEVLPVILYLHGGGWVFGDANTYGRTRRELTVRAHAAVIFVVYSLSPEVQYPVALEECYDALTWTFFQGKSILVDPDRIAIAGDSAGGNLAAAVTMLDKQRSLGAVKHQVLYYPVTDSNLDQPSYEEFATGYQLEASEMPVFWDHYVPNGKDRLSPLVAPLRATTQDLEGLPPALVITAEADVLRDEGEAYARKLMAAHVPTVATRYLGTIHSFLKHTNLSASAIAAYDQTASELQKSWR